MSRKPHNFKLSDTARLLRAAEAAGMPVERLEYDPQTKRIALIAPRGDAAPATSGGVDKLNPWDALKP